MDTLSGASQKGRAFAKAFDEASIQILWRYVDIFWKTKKLLNIGSEAVMKKNIKLIDDFVYDLIDSKIKQRHELKDDLVSEASFRI